MKNKLIKISIVAAAVLVVLSACNRDRLDTAPVNNVSEATAFATPDRFKTQMNGLYDAMKSGNFYGGRFLIYHDIRGEEFLNELNNGVTGLSTWNHTILSGTNEVNNLWNAVYYTINSCNIYLEALEKNKTTQVLKDQTLANNYAGEARFLRAVCYYSLLSLYAPPFADGNGSKAGVPLRLKAEKSLDNKLLAPATVAQVYDQIIADLDFAEANLPTNYSSAYLNTTRAHKNTAIAFKTRVYLAKQDYAKVITEANKIVPAAAPFKAAAGVAHQLQTSIASVFTTPYTTVESIFSMPMNDADPPGTQNGVGYYWAPTPKGNGEYSLNPNGIIGDTVTFRPADARRSFIVTGGSLRYLNKFPSGPAPANNDYVPVIRYAEVLLNLAEALARTNGVDARALALLNAVHQRSDAGFTYAAGSFADGAALANAILKERRMELLGEGFRSADCMRLLLDIPAKSGKNGNVPAIKSNQADVYYWPYPSGETAVNTLCKR